MLFMGLIITLGAIGIANGLWSKTLEIRGQVTTGDLNADWDCGYTNDDGQVQLIIGVAGHCVGLSEPTGDDGRDPNNYNWPDFTDSTPFIRKDVGECHLTIGSDNFGAQVATVRIVNAYPSYECTIALKLSNTGSIPFNFIGAGIQNLPPQLELLNNNCQFPQDGQQIDPGLEATVLCTVHVKQSAAQNTCTGTSVLTPHVIVTENCGPNPPVVYSFRLLACVAQWNEAANLAQCIAANTEGPTVGP
jgi:hypothetical protein